MLFVSKNNSDTDCQAIEGKRESEPNRKRKIYWRATNDDNSNSNNNNIKYHDHLSEKSSAVNAVNTLTHLPCVYRTSGIHFLLSIFPFAPSLTLSFSHSPAIFQTTGFHIYYYYYYALSTCLNACIVCANFSWTVNITVVAFWSCVWIWNKSNFMRKSIVLWLLTHSSHKQ